MPDIDKYRDIFYKYRKYRNIGNFSDISDIFLYFEYFSKFPDISIYFDNFGYRYFDVNPCQNGEVICIFKIHLFSQIFGQLQ